MIYIFKKTTFQHGHAWIQKFFKGSGIEVEKGGGLVEVNMIQIYLFFSFHLFLLSFDKGGANPIIQRRCTVQVKQNSYKMLKCSIKIK